MVFLLITNVIRDPLQIFRPERHDSVSTLPLESFGLNFVVNVMRAGTFQLPDIIGHQQIRRSAQTDMNVRLDPADSVKPDLGCFQNAMS